MKNEELRHCVVPPAREPLPKAERRPCMRGVMDVELYNRTGEVVMIEPLTEYVSPIDPMVATPINPSVIRRAPRMPIVKRPAKDDLERALRSGMSADELAVKYKAKKMTVYNWIRAYELQGIKGVEKPETEVTEVPGADAVITRKTAPVNPPAHVELDLSKVENFCTPVPLSALDDRWLQARDILVGIRRSDIDEVEKSFREKLRGLLADVAGEWLG